MKQTFTNLFKILLCGLIGFGFAQAAFAQYCIPTQSGTSAVSNVTFNTLNNTSPLPVTPYYVAFPASGATTTSVTVGSSYPLTVTTDASAIVSVWIDFDHNNVFDATEWQQVMTTGTSATITIAIPAATIPGSTGMRVRSRAMGNTNGAIDACTGFGSGECEDYTIDILAAGPCINPVNGGVATASLAAICPLQSSFISASGISFGTGIVYQWYSAASATGPWTAIAGANSTSYSVMPTATTFYQLETICSGGTAAYSNAVQVDINTVINCYCAAQATSVADEEILNVTLGSLNQSSTCATTGTNATSILSMYSDYTAGVGAPAAPILQQGAPISFSFEAGTCGGTFGNAFAAWIDFNQNGSFEPSETVYASPTISTGPHTEVGSFTVPVVATPGLTRLRVILNEGGTPTNPCQNVLWGEVEDYLVEIQVAAPCTNPPNPGVATASVPAICPTHISHLAVTGQSYGAGIAYQWYAAANAAGPWTAIAGATTDFYDASPTTDTYYHLETVCSGGTAVFTNDLFVTVNTFVNCYCSAQALNIADEEILNVTLGTLNQSSTCTTTGTGATSLLNLYSDYTSGAGAPPAPVLLLGSTVPYSFQAGTCGGAFNNGFAAWIDYNQNGTFEATEKIYASAATTAGPHTETGTVLIPATATSGLTRMRVILSESIVPTDPCANMTWGEVEDYLVNIQQPLPCTNPPMAGTISAANLGICLGNSTALNVQNADFGTGIVYQWYSSASATGPWTAIAGATLPYYTAAPTTDTYYRFEVICNGGTPVYTPAVQVTLNPFYLCYCTASAQSTFGEDIFNVTFGSINQTSSCTTTGTGASSVLNRYSDYTTGTGAPTPTYITAGQSESFSFESGDCSAANAVNRFAAWIDYNQNGIFEASELVYNSPTNVTGPHIETGLLIIPPTAIPGITRMRILLSEGTLPITDPCVTTFFAGEVEDYLVEIGAAFPCIDPVIGGMTTASVTNICTGTTSPVTFDVASGSVGTGLTYQWQTATSAAGPWTDISGATNYNYNTTLNTTGFYRRSIICAGGTVDYSTPVEVRASFLNCYCAAQATSVADEEILNVTVGTLNQSSTCTSIGTGASSQQSMYSDYTSGVGAPTPPQFTPGSIVNLSLEAGTCGGTFSNAFAVWIDYNHNGIFNTNERVYFTATATMGAHIETGVFAVPANAQRGLTRMRVILTESTVAPTDPCINVTWGEVEDYFVDIVCPAVVLIPTVSVPAVCVGGSVTLNVNSYAANGTYTWSGNGTSATGQTATFNNVTATGTTYTVIARSSACTATASVSVQVSRPVPVFTTVSPSCNGGMGSVSIVGSGGIAPYTFSSASGAVTSPFAAAAGTYTVSATDALNCVASASVVITQPTIVSAAVTTVAQTAIPGNGSATVTPTGGTGPTYTYTWDNGMMAQTITDLTSGNYCVTVTDMNGCTQTACAAVAYNVATVNTANFNLIKAFPNPTDGRFSLELGLANASDITVDIVTVTGVNIASQTATSIQNKRFDFDLTTMPSGIYFVRIKANDESSVLRITVTK